MRHNHTSTSRDLAARRRRQRIAWLLAAAGGLAVINHLQRRRAEAAHPPRGRFLDLAGVRLHCHDRGSGPPVVMLHGNGAMAADFAIAGVSTELADKFRVLAFDRPGFGYSSRPRRQIWTPRAQARLIAMALERLGIPKAIVVGHSWGTLVALALALEQPQRVQSLVLVSGYYLPTPRLALLLAWPQAVPVLGDLICQTIAPWLARLTAPFLVRRSFAPAPVTQAFSSRFPFPLCFRPSQLRAFAEETAIMIGAAASLAGEYSRLKHPVTIVTGAADRIVDPDRQSRRLAGILPNATLRVIPETGHMAHHTTPEAVIAAVEHAFREAAPGPATMNDQAPAVPVSQMPAMPALRPVGAG